MIRITIKRKGQPLQVKEFDDINLAGRWLIEDSYMTNPDVISFTWENIPPCEHVWGLWNSDEDDLEFTCTYNCGATAKISHGYVTAGVKKTS